VRSGNSSDRQAQTDNSTPIYIKALFILVFFFFGKCSEFLRCNALFSAVSRAGSEKSSLFLKKIHPQTVRFDARTNLFSTFIEPVFSPKTGFIRFFGSVIQKTL